MEQHDSHARAWVDHAWATWPELQPYNDEAERRELAQLERRQRRNGR